MSRIGKPVFSIYFGSVFREKVPTSQIASPKELKATFKGGLRFVRPAGRSYSGVKVSYEPDRGNR